MAEARNIEITPVAERVGGLDLVLVSANDPAAMIRHSQECRSRGYAFAADPSQQLARMEGSDVLTLISGAEYLLTNEYERSMLETKAALTGDQVLEHVKVRVTTLGKDGVEITGRDIERIHVPVARDVGADDPTGVGDGVRAGFFAAVSWGLGLERAAQVGSLVAALVLETVGPQEYEIKPDFFAKRFADSYGDQAAAEIQPFLAATA
jgi:adenosine kinase